MIAPLENFLLQEKMLFNLIIPTLIAFGKQSQQQ